MTFLNLVKSCSEDPHILIPCSFEVPVEGGKRQTIRFNPSNQGSEHTNENLSGHQSATQNAKAFYINCARMQCRINFIDTPGIGDTRYFFDRIMMKIMNLIYNYVSFKSSSEF